MGSKDVYPTKEFSNIENAFKKWWKENYGQKMSGSRYLAKKTWVAAIKWFIDVLEAGQVFVLSRDGNNDK